MKMADKYTYLRLTGSHPTSQSRWQVLCVMLLIVVKMKAEVPKLYYMLLCRKRKAES